VNPPVTVNAELTLEPSELVAGGDALAKVDGFPLFVPGLYPGDVARVRVVEVKKGFARGELLRLERPSALRRAAPCPIADECGGCDWTSLRLDAQLRAKERILRESLRRIGKLAVIPEITLHPSPLNYRLRSRLHADGTNTGFYAAASHRVVPLVPECEVVGPRTAAVVGVEDGQSCPSSSGQTPRPDGQDCPSSTKQGPPARDDEFEIWELDGQLIDDPREIAIDVDRYHFRLSTDVFFQVNRHLLATMLRLVHGHAERTADKRRAVDLYSGVGFFTAPLAEVFERVSAVEGSAVSHHWALANAAGNVEALHAPIEAWVHELPRASFIFLDPPRSGAKPNVIDAIAKRAREVICFLACDPVIFARDANRLTASGWRLTALDLLDLFPNTHHVETLARFERA
jgi:23S rRNA (uracil1939-C5)-methyltransferase